MLKQKIERQQNPSRLKNFIFEFLALIKRRIKKQTIGIKNKKNVEGLQNPNNHSFFPSDNIMSQNIVINSKAFTIKKFGIPKSSVKNTIELKIKKIVSIGAKIRLPINVIIDICKPHPTRMGIETRGTIN